MVITLRSSLWVLLLLVRALMSVRIRGRRSKSSTGRWQYMHKCRYFGSKNFQRRMSTNSPQHVLPNNNKNNTKTILIFTYYVCYYWLYKSDNNKDVQLQMLNMPKLPSYSALIFDDLFYSNRAMVVDGIFRHSVPKAWEMLNSILVDFW